MSSHRVWFQQVESEEAAIKRGSDPAILCKAQALFGEGWAYPSTYKSDFNDHMVMCVHLIEATLASFHTAEPEVSEYASNRWVKIPWDGDIGNKVDSGDIWQEITPASVASFSHYAIVDGQLEDAPLSTPDWRNCQLKWNSICGSYLTGEVSGLPGWKIHSWGAQGPASTPGMPQPSGIGEFTEETAKDGQQYMKPVRTGKTNPKPPYNPVFAPVICKKRSTVLCVSMYGQRSLTTPPTIRRPHTWTRSYWTLLGAVSRPLVWTRTSVSIIQATASKRPAAGSGRVVAC